MKTIRNAAALALAAGLSCAGSLGCKSAEKELAAVAKRWSLTIRASQVIPVYPLTEDLQPGDVFVVTTPVQDEASTYTKKGFLPLPMNVARLSGLDFTDFYGDAYWKGTYATAPHERPSEGAVGAPRAFFPTYDFQVERGSGLKLALPVQGVPVGLGLMRADSASGSVLIQDAYTYGLSGEEVYVKLAEWARTPAVQGELARLAGAVRGKVYLRVISRVYLTRGVTVSLRNTSASSTELDAGEPKEIELLQSSNATNAENYQRTLDTLNDTLEKSLPGGSLRIAQASQSSVTLAETFDRPLVLGYLGFDVELFENGELGPPVATSDRLARGEDEPVVAGRLGEAERQLDFRRLELHEVIAADPENGHQPNPAGAVRAIAYAAERLPKDDFGAVAEAARAALADPDAIDADAARAILERFQDAVAEYVTRADTENRARTVTHMVDAGLAHRFPEGG